MSKSRRHSSSARIARVPDALGACRPTASALVRRQPEGGRGQAYGLGPQAGVRPGVQRPAGRVHGRRRADEAEPSARSVATIATFVSARPVLCDLVSSQAAVLEHNVSPEIAAD